MGEICVSATKSLGEAQTVVNLTQISRFVNTLSYLGLLQTHSQDSFGFNCA